MKICIVGYQGKMGQVMAHVAVDAGHEVFGLGLFTEEKVYTSLLDAPKPDVIVDFSVPQALDTYLADAQDLKVACVIATTGYTPAQQQQITTASQHIPIFQSANFSLGIFVLNQLLQQATKQLKHMDVDVYDVHHKFKQDAPSGTAKHLIDTILEHRELQVESNQLEARQQDKLYVHVSRQGSVVGQHRIVFSDTAETIELKHSAHSKEVFAKGALKASEWVIHQSAGLYAMEDLWNNS